MQRTSFEWLSQIVIPVLLLGATIATAVKDQPRLAELLAAGIILSFAVSVMPALVRRWSRFRERSRADAVARAVWPELLRLVQVFGKFIDQNRSDTLHGIVMQISTPDRAAFLLLVRQQDFVPASVLYGPWKQLSDLTSKAHGAATLQQVTEQFSWLVSTYRTYVIEPVFGVASKGFHEPMTPQIRQELTTCRDSLTRFLDDYEALLARTNAQFGNALVATPVFRRISAL